MMFETDNDFDYGSEWDQAEQMATQAFECYENGDMPAALEKLSQAIESGPEHAEWYFNMALTLDGMEQYEKAVQYYCRALEFSPEDVEIMNCLGVNYTRTAQYDLSLSMFEQIERIDPMFEPAYCNRIITYTEMEQYNRAEQMFYMAQQIKPDCPLCYYNIGNSLFTQGEYDRALWCWDKCAELAPDHPQIHYRLAQACWVGGKGERAREEFLIELRSNPMEMGVLLDFGVFLLESGDLDSAMEKFNRALEYDPACAAAHFYMGEIYRTRQIVTRAVRCYMNAIKYDQALNGPRFRLAEIASAGGDVHETREMLRAEFQLNPEDADVLVAMGWMFLKIGDLTDASNCFMQALNEGEANDEPFFGLGMSLAIHGDYAGALECLEQATALAPERVELRLCAGWIYYKLEQWGAVDECLEKCRVICPKQEPFSGRCRQLGRAVRYKKFMQRLGRLLPWRGQQKTRAAVTR
ncbi:MAG: tetratricopeptide repeat protein [Planctomycetota bacterium]|jgi:tetratricopeptide (TPR) repeat protein